MKNEVLKKIRGNPNFISPFLEGLSLIYRSGIFEFLRAAGRVTAPHTESINYAEQQKASANWSLGYNTALDDLLYFRERYLEPTTANLKDFIDFGGLEDAVERGDLTKEEADGLKLSK